MRRHVYCNWNKASLLRDGKTWEPTILSSRTTLWTMQTQRKTFQLGGRPAKQGPRPRNQGRVEKSVTGSTMMKNTTILSQGYAKQLQLCNKLRLGTCNIRSMLQLGKVQLLCKEMMRLGVDICGLSEVRWHGQGHFTTLDGRTIVYSGRPT